MFGKKKKAPETENPAVQADVTPEPKAKKEKAPKKKKNGLSQVFRTSVFETILEDLKLNEQFIHRQDGRDMYVALAFNTEDVGGMDKKSAKRDEAKGSIIEKISAGRMKTYITDELMDEGLIVFIPEPMTMSEMDDFSILTSANYELCTIDINGDIELLGQYVDYRTVCDVLMSEGHVDEILQGEDSDIPDMGEEMADTMQDTANDSLAGMSGEDVPFTGDLSDVDSLDDTDDIDGDDDEIPDMDDDDVDSVDDDLVDADTGRSAGSYAPVDTGYGSSEDTYDSMGTEDMQAGPEPEPMPEEAEQEIPAQWTYQAMVRKFYSDDLGLEVTTEPFDAQFLGGNTFIPFDENRPEGWLNEQLNEMSRQANLDLAKLHEENLFILRERYFKLISAQCDRIAKDLSIHDPETQYGQWYQQIEQDKELHVSNLDSTVNRKKQELDAEWKERLQKIGMDAARAAQRQYRERYQQAHSERVAALEDTVKASCVADFEDCKKEILERRRMEAATLLDLSISETINEVSDMYLTMMADENLRYKECQENMRIFRDELMKEDIIRTHALDEELRQTDKADQVLAEQTAKIRALTDDFNAKKQSLHQELANLRADNKAKIEDMRQEADARVERVLADKQKSDDRFDELMKNYETLEASIEQRYKQQMAELKDKLSSAENECEHLMNTHARSNRISVFLLVATVIAAIAIGFVGGEFVSSKRQIELYAQQSYQKMMNDVQTESEK